jgi:photosystem II stability/assembly factor-like uncharacterized protein
VAGSRLGGVARSTDGGATWSHAVLGDAVHALAFDPTDPMTLYAGTGGGGVRKSADGGRTWARLPSTGLADPYILSLAIDATGATLYAGTAESGVFSLQ